jgi:uncharacterized phage protein gp47/JayE
VPVQGDHTLYRTRDEIVTDLLAGMQAAIPDIYTGIDGNVRILFEVLAGMYESIFLSQQLLSEDMFVETANPVALTRYGDQFGIPQKAGTRAKGNLLLTGAGGTYVPIGASVAHDPGGGLEPLAFFVTLDGTLPNPGNPIAPVATLNATAGNLTGVMEYAVSFLTVAGESLQGPDSNAVYANAQRMTLTGIPLGGPGTTGRRIYRQQDGGNYQLLTTINDNTTTTFADNVANASLGGAPLAVQTAAAITLPAEAEDAGSEYNVLPGAISELSDAPDGLVAVNNPAAFTGGSDPETTADYRTRLLDAIRAPSSGSPEDLKSWAEAVDGVGTATVFSNDNLGVAANGHTTVRITAADGTVPDATIVTAVLTELQSHDIANITIHVTTFTPLPTNVTVTVTPQAGFLLSDVIDSVNLAISNYVNGLDVAETFRVAGVVEAVFGLVGVADVIVTAPASNQTTGATQKRTIGTITIQ